MLRLAHFRSIANFRECGRAKLRLTPEHVLASTSSSETGIRNGGQGSVQQLLGGPYKGRHYSLITREEGEEKLTEDSPHSAIDLGTVALRLV